MANIINLDAESQANMIGDDAEPTLSLTNSSTGPGLYGGGAVLVSSASIDIVNITGPGASNILGANATLGMQLVLSTPSRASGAVAKLNAGALVSLTSVLATTGGVAGTYGLRVEVGDGNFGWIPVYPDGAVTAAVPA